LKADASRVSWRRNGLELVGKGASDGGSVDVDFGDDTLYGYYTLQAEDSTTGIARGYIEVGQAKLAPMFDVNSIAPESRTESSDMPH
jgi:hypothetical protein